MYINVNEYKDRASDAEMIQAALDAASLNGKAVVIPKYNERTGMPLWDIDQAKGSCPAFIL
jgi:hypothetical protein